MILMYSLILKIKVSSFQNFASYFDLVFSIIIFFQLTVLYEEYPIIVNIRENGVVKRLFVFYHLPLKLDVKSIIKENYLQAANAQLVRIFETSNRS